jgi:hydroxyacylglutathione hydrolase
MLLKYFYDSALAHASYLVGCQRTGEAVVVDPGRNVDEYLQAARREGVRLTAVAETHIHADYVSGARELAERAGAKLFVSDEGPAEWKYEYLEPYAHQLLTEGDTFSIGNVRFDVLHTPGHTPESISFLITDEGGGASEPMGIFTGDFVFVGSIGRPDLLEEAAGIAGTAEPGARDLFRSAERFKQLPDYLQVWPAHGAGSACGKGLGAIPSSTVGYEKRFNPALQYDDEEAFVKYILADQPESPKYFAVMKRVNKEGPAVLGEHDQVRTLPAEQIESALREGTVVDLSPAERYAAGHVRGTINIPLESLAHWGGWLIDYERPTYLIGEPEAFEPARRILRKIGVEQLHGAFPREQLANSGLTVQTYQSVEPTEVARRLESEQLRVWDVRSREEWKEGHVDGAEHHFLGRLDASAEEVSREEPVAVYCQRGARSKVAVSVLEAAGFSQVIDMVGGYAGWRAAGLPSTKDPEPAARVN